MKYEYFGGTCRVRVTCGVRRGGILCRTHILRTSFCVRPLQSVVAGDRYLSKSECSVSCGLPARPDAGTSWPDSERQVTRKEERHWATDGTKKPPRKSDIRWHLHIQNSRHFTSGRGQIPGQMEVVQTRTGHIAIVCLADQHWADLIYSTEEAERGGKRGRRNGHPTVTSLSFSLKFSVKFSVNSQPQCRCNSLKGRTPMLKASCFMLGR